MHFTSGRVVLQGGNLTQSIINQVSLGADNKVTNLIGNKLTLTITLSSGRMSGNVTDPATRKSIRINGVVHQKQNAGWGYFLGTTQSGSVYFGE